MKLTILIFAGLLSWANLLSQSNKSKTYNESDRKFLQVSIPDTTYRHFLNRHDSLQSVSVIYTDKEPYTIFLNFPKSERRKERLHFDLVLAGDRYFFEGKYGTIQYFNTEQIDQIPWPGNEKAIILRSTTFDGDSVVCYGELETSDVARSNRDWGVGSPAKYQGDISSLAAQIAERLGEEGKGEVIDPALVFEGTITRHGYLRDLTLVLGEKSVFSDVAEEALLWRIQESGEKLLRMNWFPASIDRGPIEAKIRIFVKLEQNGAIKIETPRKLRTFSGS